MSAPVKKCEVTPIEARCAICLDTGEVGQMGYLDCKACDVATKRAELESWAQDHCLAHVGSDDLWRIHQHALAAAPVVPVAAQPTWKALSDVQWMNIVNHGHAYAQYSKDDAVHLAVKMTEAKCRELNAGTVSPVDMILRCPACHTQHIDAPDDRTAGWSNPPHRSHLCHECGHIWRPADVATNGVAAIKTARSADSKAIAAPSLEAQPAGEASAPNAALVAALKEACDLIRLEVADGVHTEEYSRGMAALSAAGQEVKS